MMGLIGNHKVEFVPSDLFPFTPIGDVSTEEGSEIMAHLERHSAPLMCVWILFDLTQARAVPASVRKSWADRAMKPGIIGGAMFGASLRTRVLVRMFEGITELFTTQRKPILHTSAKTKEEELAWLESRRHSVTSQHPSSAAAARR